MRPQIPRVDLPTGTVTFLFTDIEGSTRLAQRTAPEQFLALIETHYGLIREAIAAHHGVEVRTEGDAFFVAFASAADGVEAAMDAQRALAGHPWPEGRQIAVRMGLHVGEGRLGGDDYFGIDVHRAARIADAGHGGQIVISAEVAADIGPLLARDVSLTDLGRHRLKDLISPEHLYQVAGDGLTVEFPPLRSEGGPRHRLPAPVSSFVGRSRETGDVIELIRSCRLVTLTGLGGTGKTRLAEQVARLVADEFDDGGFFVALADITEPAMVTAAVLDGLAAPWSSDGDQEAQLLRYLESRQALVVLDNFEHVLDAAPLVGRVLESSPGVRVLVTSRAPLRVAGEREYAVAPLEIPASGDSAESPRALLGVASVELFVDRAREAQPGFDLSDTNAADVAELARRLEGLPLAIELVAARTKVWPPRLILEHLDSRLVSGTERDLPERQQTLWNTIGWSYDLLDEASQQLFAELGVFVGGAGLDEIGMVAASDGVDLWDALANLVDHSLVTRRDTLGEPRFGMLEMVRGYAVERLRRGGDEDVVRHRHAESYLGLARLAQPELTGRRRADRLQRLAVEHGNLHGALSWATSASEAELALAMVGSLWRFWQMAGHLDEAAEHVEAVLALSGGRPETRARAREAAGGIAYWRGDFAEQKTHYTAALDAWRDIGDELEVANACYNIGYSVAITEGRDAGMALLLEAEEIYRRHGDDLGLGRAYWAQANLHQIDNDYETAVELCERSIELFVGDEVVFELGWAEFVLAENLMSLGRLDEARAHLHRGMDLFLDAGDLSAMVLFLGAFAELARLRGDMETAMRLAGATSALRRATGAGIVETDPAHADHLSPESVGDDGHAEGHFRRGEGMSLSDAVALAMTISSRPLADPA